MSRRKLSALIAAALFGAGAVAAQIDPQLPERGVEPPPAAAQSMRGQPFPPTQVEPATDLDELGMVVVIDPFGERHIVRRELLTPEADVAVGPPASDRMVVTDEDGQRFLIERELLVAEFGPDADDDFDEPVRVTSMRERSGAAAASTATRTDSPHRDPHYRERVTDDSATIERDQDPIDYAEQPLQRDEFHQGDELAAQRGEEEVTIITGGFEPFADAAGTQGFSDGATAQAAQRAFQRQDHDDDGNIQRDEVRGTHLADRFADYDINGDGAISRNEFQSWFAAQRDLGNDPLRALAASEPDELDGDDGLAAADDDL